MLRQKMIESPERINIFFTRLFLKEEIGQGRGPLACRFVITTRKEEEIFDVSFASAEILMVQHLKMPSYSPNKFNERFKKEGISIEEITATS